MAADQPPRPNDRPGAPRPNDRSGAARPGDRPGARAQHRVPVTASSIAESGRGRRTPWPGRALAGVGFSLYVIGTVLYLSKWQWLCALALLLGSAAMLYFSKRLWKIFAVAFVLGSVGEYLCVAKFDLWRYQFPTFYGGLPVWIGLVWGYLFAVYALIAELFEPTWDVMVPGLRRLLGVAFAIAFLLFFREVMGRISIYIAYYYILFLALALVHWNKPSDALIFIVAGLGGTWGEYMSIQKGLWIYTHPAFAETGMPISLPMAWGFAAVFVRNAATRFWHSIGWLTASAAILVGMVKYVL